MRRQLSVRVVLIRPAADFGSVESVERLCPGAGFDKLQAKFFCLPVLAILVGHDGLPLYIPNLYLADCALRGRSVKGDTARSYAEALASWLRFIDGRGVPIADADEQLFAVFRSELVHGSAAGRAQPLARSTANHRISVVSSFYLWAERRSLMRTPLGAFLAARADANRGRSRLTTTAGRSGGSLAPTVLQRLPKILSIDELRQLFLFAKQPFRLMFKWSLVTGLRRFEVCDLLVDQLPSASEIALSRDALVQVNVLRKGSRITTIQVPVALAEETNWYVLADRPRPIEFNEKRVFLTERGLAISRSALTREFRRCGNSIGTRATLHHLRHTFAVNVLTVLERHRGEDDSINSLKALQIMMGHASIDSTETYLRSIEASGDDVMEALSYLYGATIS